MNFFKITVKAGLGFDQSRWVEALKQDGGDCIQTSDGLFAASSQSQDALLTTLKALDVGGALQVELIRPGTSDENNLSLDMQSLMKKHSS